jgi:hypothetical protein
MKNYIIKYSQYINEYKQPKEAYLIQLENQYEEADSFKERIRLGREIDSLRKELGMKTNKELEKEAKIKRELEQKKFEIFCNSQIDKFAAGKIKIDFSKWDIQDRPLKPFKVPTPLYRGQRDNSNGLSENGGMAIFGDGLYTTPSRKYASSYGSVMIVDENIAMPLNPLYFESMLHVNQFEFMISVELFLNKTSKRYLYNDKARNLDFYIKGMGYDGIVVKYHDSHMVVVKY